MPIANMRPQAWTAGDVKYYRDVQKYYPSIHTSTAKRKKKRKTNNNTKSKRKCVKTRKSKRKYYGKDYWYRLRNNQLLCSCNGGKRTGCYCQQ